MPERCLRQQNCNVRLLPRSLNELTINSYKHRYTKIVEEYQPILTAFLSVHQIFYAIIDQTIFGEQSIPSKDTSSIVEDLKKKYTSWKHVEGTHWQSRFNHLLNYGAGASEIMQTFRIASRIEKSMYW